MINNKILLTPENYKRYKLKNVYFIVSCSTSTTYNK
jgi:hypothetical protein